MLIFVYYKFPRWISTGNPPEFHRKSTGNDSGIIPEKDRNLGDTHSWLRYFQPMKRETRTCSILTSRKIHPEAGYPPSGKRVLAPGNTLINKYLYFVLNCIPAFTIPLDWCNASNQQQLGCHLINCFTFRRISANISDPRKPSHNILPPSPAIVSHVLLLFLNLVFFLIKCCYSISSLVIC